MNPKGVLPLLAVFVVTVSCQGSNDEGIAAAQPSVPQAESASSTSKEFARPTATSSPVPLTPTPTERTVLTLSQWENAALQAADLAAGFIPAEFDEEDLAVAEAGLGEVMGEKVSIASSFAFYDDMALQLVFGYVVYLPDQDTRAAFDATVVQPDSLLAFLNSEWTFVQFTDRRQLAGANTIGDTSAAVTQICLTDKDYMPPVREDVAIFRRDGLGAIMMAWYFDGDEPGAPILDLAKKLELRMRDAQ
jgi:hypothetical protein